MIPAAWSLIEDADSSLPDALRPIFAEACREIHEIEARIKQVERRLTAISEQLPAVEQLRTIPGVGLLTSTALVGFIGEIRRFPTARHFASYIGLTPPDRLREWANDLAKTHVHNKAAVAVANKRARIVWAVWKHERPFALMAKAA